MDKVGNYLSYYSGKLISTAKVNEINQIIFFQKGEYAFMNYYVSTPDGIPDPIYGSDINSYIRFISKSPCNITVDWDDGTIETFEMQYNGSVYNAGWRSLTVDYYKNPDSTGGGWNWGINQTTKEYIKPYPNHHYTDGDNEKIRHIKMIFSSPDVYYLQTSTIAMWEFPIIELYNLEQLFLSYTKYIKEIPFLRISKLKNLKQLSLTSLGLRLEVIPESIFTMTNLTSLNVSNIFNLSNIQSSNFRKISALKNLSSLTLTSCYINSYIKEFNDLPKLSALDISNANRGIDGIPSFSEVDKINPRIRIFNVLGAEFSGGGQRTSWMNEEFSGKGLENITYFPVNHQNKISIVPPEYLKEMNALKELSLSQSLRSQERADGWVNNLYDYIIQWEEITMSNTLKNGKRNQFYGLTLYAGSATGDNYRPSGQYQAPQGFILGSNNGNPQTPMEKIYVLEQNYKQKWQIKPETTSILNVSDSTLYLSSPMFNDYPILNDEDYIN